jgi:UV DNA damage repair endonuclease
MTKTNTILGLTCISEELKGIDKKKYSFQTMTRKRFNDLCVRDSKNEAIKELSERIAHNLYCTQYILRHCGNNDIKHYRLSSSLFPLLTDQTLELAYTDLPNHKTLDTELGFIGIIAKTLGISLSSHPDQFNVLASANENSVNKSINELNFQASLFDKIGLPQDHTAPMNIHINGTPPEIESDNDADSINNARIAEMAERFYNNLMRCDEGVYNRLTIENEDKGFWNVDNILKFSDYIFEKYKFNLPICFDNLHHMCNPSEDRNVAFQAERCAYTWVNQGKGENSFLAPVFHWSEGKPEKPRSHADYFALGSIPPHIAIDPDQEVKWECEVKGKDKAIKLLRQQMQISSEIRLSGAILNSK